MTTTQLIIRADFLLEALPYIQKYRGETFVVNMAAASWIHSDPEERDSVPGYHVPEPVGLTRSWSMAEARPLHGL
jgi:hypothetical protein